MAPGTNQDDSLLELFVFETSQNTQQLEQVVLTAEREGGFSHEEVNEVFRIMHTIKGSAAMMSYVGVAKLAHRMEDLFFYIRENPSAQYDPHAVSDLILSCMDFINQEMENVRAGQPAGQEDNDLLIHRIDALMAVMTGAAEPHTWCAAKARTGECAAAPVELAAETLGAKRFKAVIRFEDGCAMEDVRAYSVTIEVGEYAKVLSYEPADIMENGQCAEKIRSGGFTIRFETDLNMDEVRLRLLKTVFLSELELIQEAEAAPQDDEPQEAAQDEPSGDMAGGGEPAKKSAGPDTVAQYHQQPQSIISVSVNKLDMMMDLMGELVIAKTMVVENPEVAKLEVADFQKSAAHLSKIVTEMQELVMSMRLVPLSATFHRMHRIVRDMGSALNKDVRLTLLGEDTSVDKNVIEHIADPLIHLVRNSIDHGIESAEERASVGKSATSSVTLEAQNAGGNVLISIRDDGRGLDREKILARARANGLLVKPESDYSDREVYNMIFLPGFSTKEKVTEFSGRGVGMDVVMQNIAAIGGSVSIESEPGKGMNVLLKIPLTIAILDGMNVCVGDTRLTVPISAICESFKPRQQDIIRDIEGNEMIMVRGECYAVLRLHRQWGVESSVAQLPDGILMMVEQDGRKRCVFVDKLVGRQQVVVKALPTYLKKTPLSQCLSGLTLLGDGSISLILDAGWLVETSINGL
jgi:two-component system chemotaxis sensor kinase CheA